jgi:hypothetical protein
MLEGAVELTEWDSVERCFLGTLLIFSRFSGLGNHSEVDPWTDIASSRHIHHTTVEPSSCDAMPHATEMLRWRRDRVELRWAPQFTCMKLGSKVVVCSVVVGYRIEVLEAVRCQK